ncbi:TPA: hypothetical protein DCQ44_01395 [Candidatus Taylorbacteria bacterium]|nr:hypothetical protein [Candidatus Taylorbacteria bacterium]
MNVFQTVVYAFFAGLLPALVWLWFWLHEDRLHPEPRSTLAFTFTTGMAMIFLAIPIEAFFAQAAPTPMWRFLAWAAVEEVLKFTAAYLAAIHTRFFDEPLDAVIYMMCAALGFAALENTLFILNSAATALPSADSGLLSTIFLTNLRFIGANLLHVIASSVVGVALALSFKKSRQEKIVWLVGGLILATVLHTMFNLLIIDSSSAGIFLVFLMVWLIMIGLILMFEKIKKMQFIQP